MRTGSDAGAAARDDAPDGTVVDLAVIGDGDEPDARDRARLHEQLVAGSAVAARGEAGPARDVLARLRPKRR